VDRSGMGQMGMYAGGLDAPNCKRPQHNDKIGFGRYGQTVCHGGGLIGGPGEATIWLNEKVCPSDSINVQRASCLSSSSSSLSNKQTTF